MRRRNVRIKLGTDTPIYWKGLALRSISACFSLQSDNIQRFSELIEVLDIRFIPCPTITLLAWTGSFDWSLPTMTVRLR
jgi:hypothetical protein